MAEVLTATVSEALEHTAPSLRPAIQERRGSYLFVIDHGNTEEPIPAHLEASSTTGQGHMSANSGTGEWEYAVMIPSKDVTEQYVNDIRDKIEAAGFSIAREYQSA